MQVCINILFVCFFDTINPTISHVDAAVSHNLAVFALIHQISLLMQMW